MTLTPTPEIQRFIEQQIACGAYRDENELLIEAVRMLRSRDERNERRAALIADLEKGIQSLDDGLGQEVTARQILANKS